MIIQGKVWGKVFPIFEKNNVQINRIEARKGTFCSEHKHDHNFNMFFVESGKIKIKTWKNNYNLIDEIILTNLQATIVEPSEFHSFESIEDSIVYEIYWVTLNNNDIIRRTVGGEKNDGAI